MSTRPEPDATSSSLPQAGHVGRFVVQHHVLGDDDSHFDWMFDIGGTLATWRAPIPLLDLRASIRLKRIGDHRIAYLEYEGPVSGDRGHVAIRQRGTFAVLNCRDTSWFIAIRDQRIPFVVKIVNTDEGVIAARCKT
jgi:hypothetical protein